MYARRVYMHLKPNSVAEFAQRVEKDIIPNCFENSRGSKTRSRLLPIWNGSVRDQFVGSGGKRRGLQPRRLPRSGEDPRDSD